jgi:uncharacterized protein with PIN domain
MLGSLSRWLRICGYDTFYLRNASDENLIQEAKKAKRVLLTRDKYLYRKSLKEGLIALYVEGESDLERLSCVAKRFNMALDPKMSKCPNCGDILEVAEKEEITDKIPQGSLETYDEFWMCMSCRKVFWRGSHWKNIVKTIEEATKLASHQVST